MKSIVTKTVISAVLITGLVVVVAPVWEMLPFFGVPCLAIIWWPRRRSPVPGHCVNCGYNLTGNVSGRCPECGESVQHKQ